MSKTRKIAKIIKDCIDKSKEKKTNQNPWDKIGKKSTSMGVRG